MNRFFATICVAVVLAGGLQSCKLGRKPVRKKVIVDSTTGIVTQIPDTGYIGPLPDTSGMPVTATPPTESTHGLTAEKQALVATLQPLSDHKISFNTFSGKAKMHYEGNGEKQDFTANFRIRQDSVIWVSVSALGGIVQVARLMITQDSIVLLNFLQKEVTKMPIADAKKLLPADVDFRTLQNLIVGNALMDSGNATDATDFGGGWSIQQENNDYVQQITWNKSDSTMRSSQLRTRNSDSLAALIQYGNYTLFGQRNFAESRAINILNGAENHYLDMNFSSETFDEQVDFPFSIPKNYKVK